MANEPELVRIELAFRSDQGEDAGALGDRIREATGLIVGRDKLEEFDVVIAATGVLHHPRYPDIDGLDTFAGACFHSARWDHDVVLDGARVVRSVRVGRESLFEFRPEPLRDLQSYLERVSDQWEHALARLKSFVEN